MIYLITRHAGALEWLQHRITGQTVHLEHLHQFKTIGQGDTVIGTLPINQVAEISRRGARYLHLEFNLPQALRGVELSEAQLSEMGAMLVEYIAFRPCGDDAVLQRAAELEELL